MQIYSLASLCPKSIPSGKSFFWHRTWYGYFACSLKDVSPFIKLFCTKKYNTSQLLDLQKAGCLYMSSSATGAYRRRLWLPSRFVLALGFLWNKLVSWSFRRPIFRFPDVFRLQLQDICTFIPHIPPLCLFLTSICGEISTQFLMTSRLLTLLWYAHAICLPALTG